MFVIPAWAEMDSRLVSGQENFQVIISQQFKGVFSKGQQNLIMIYEMR